VAEQSGDGRLVTFVREEFGEHLGTLLLAGRGEPAGARKRSLIVMLGELTEGRRVRFLEMVADGTDLPHGDDPLVLAALFKLLTRRGAVSRLVFSLRELLALLGWEESVEEVRSVEGALERYYRTSYVEVGERRHPPLPKQLDVVAEQRLLDGYFLDDGSRRRGGRLGPRHTVVDFNSQFLDQLNRWTLFGINWELVRSISLQT
jgi:hypothetical protein